MQHGCTGYVCKNTQITKVNIRLSLLYHRNAAPQLRGTGSVWESCEAVGKLSNDDRSAAVKILLSQLHLLRDAWTEMEEVKGKFLKSNMNNLLYVI